MSEAGKLSCPSSVMDQLDGVPEIHEILKDVDKCNDHAIIRKLTALLNSLSTADKIKDFETTNGPKKILRLIDNKNKKIAKLTFLILGQYASKTDKGLHSSMLNMKVFGTLAKTLEDIDSLSYNFAQSALFLLSSVIALDKMGQMLARKSKCLHRLIVLFLRILPSLMRNENWEEERAIRESKGHRETWKVLCLSIKESINNPQNKANQQQVNTIVPKSIIFLDEWIQHAKENDPLEEFVLSLMSLLVQVLFHNQMNQTSFAAYSGISTVIRGLNKLQGFTSISSSAITDKMIRLLNAAVSGHKDNCLLAISLGGMDLLLHLVKTLPDDKKFPVIVTLTHLVHKGDVNDEKFVKAEGLSTLAVATVNVGTDPTARHAASKLLKSWAEKVSSYNKQQKKSVENDQPFRDNSLLKLKNSLVVDHQELHVESPTEDCHVNESTSLKDVRHECLDSKRALSNKSEVVAHEVMTICCNELGVSKMDSKKATISPITQQVSVVDPTEFRPIIIAQDKNEDIARDDLVDATNKNETVRPTLQKIKEDCSLHKNTDCFETNKENWPVQNTIKTINRITNQHLVSPTSTQTSCLNDTPMISPWDGLAQEGGQLTKISSLDSNLEHPQEHSKSILGQDICQENLNKSSDSEYASALDTSFTSNMSISSCYAACSVSPMKISDVTVNMSDSYNYSSSGGSMETNCHPEDISEPIVNNSSGSSDCFDEQSKSSKRSREHYEHFSRKIRNRSGSDFEYPYVRHSTPRAKKPKLAKKCSTGRSSKQRILSYQNVSLPSSKAGFSAVKLNSSITSSNNSSRPCLSPEEIDFLEEGAARFGNNFQALMESSSSTNK